ncbi:hypothetical protein N0V90_006596 [Kalmusia sp. IMI 367209]|nr:hypothetical protein N0V90_006596 [Kalmusia sp. IMI 367209]
MLADVRRDSETNEAMGEPGPEKYTRNRLHQIDSAYSSRAFEGHLKMDSVAPDEPFGHNQTRKRFSTDELTAYDLHPPPPTVSDANAEYLAARLFSTEHLDVILKTPTHAHRFRAFLNKYHPQSAPTLVRYLESQKAFAAIRYANALADIVSSTNSYDTQHLSRSSSVRSDAAVVDQSFQNFSQKAVYELVTEALPAYITHILVTIVTECLVKEITGTSSPFTRDLVQGLAEVYCMSDPNQPDNPLVFASEAVRRISETLRNGQELSEILLNYRRDGSPFLNLVMMAPLMDSRGNIRYHIGAQIDVTRLIEGGKGLESFKQLLDQEREANGDATNTDPTESKPSLELLRELGGLLNEEETDVFRHRNYLLVRPYPSLRIIFTSPALRIPGLPQSKLMDRIGGPQNIREGLMDAFMSGSSVTAKVSWLTQSSRANVNGGSMDDASTTSQEPDSDLEARPRWIHCTPMLGSDSKPGVYMIVMVDKEEITGTLNAHSHTIPVVRSRALTQETWPSRELGNSGTSAARLTSTKLYADYLRREGASDGQESTYTGKRTPVSRASLEDDIKLGRVNSGLAKVNLRTETPNEAMSTRISAVIPPKSHDSHHNSQDNPSRVYSLSMGASSPTPYKNPSTVMDLDIATESEGIGN